MLYRLLADLIVVIHFVWIIFMLLGFILTLQAFFYKRTFFNWFRFRITHLGGILYVALLSIMGKYCPLTVLENYLRSRYNPNLTYPGSFIIHYLEGLVYPGVNSLVIQIPTAFIAIFTVFAFILKPPKKGDRSK